MTTKKVAAALLIAVLTLCTAGGLWLRNADNLKPELTRLIEDQTGYEARFAGALTWSLLPPLQLHLDHLSLHNTAHTIDLRGLLLQLDLSALWQGLDQWQIDHLRLDQGTFSEDGTELQIADLRVAGFGLNRPTPVQLTVTVPDSAADTSMSVRLAGLLTYSPESAGQPARLQLADLAVEADAVRALCQATVLERPAPTDPGISTSPDALLPVDSLLQYDLDANCELEPWSLGSETLQQGVAILTLADGELDLQLQFADFIGGQLNAQLHIDANSNAPLWQITPVLQRVDSQRLMRWLEQPLQWETQISAQGLLSATGNTVAALTDSLQGGLTLDGNTGQIDISAIKTPVLRAATLLKGADEVAAWPEVWSYEQLQAQWQVDGIKQRLEVKADHVSLTANGRYAMLSGDLDMLVDVTLMTPPDDSALRINPLLTGTPIPLRCEGQGGDTRCSVREDAVQAMLARALTSDEDSALRRKLDEKIDNEVPAEYRDAARGLLDMLGRSLKKNP